MVSSVMFINTPSPFGRQPSDVASSLQHYNAVLAHCHLRSWPSEETPSNYRGTPQTAARPCSLRSTEKYYSVPTVSIVRGIL